MLDVILREEGVLAGAAFVSSTSASATRVMNQYYELGVGAGSAGALRRPLPGAWWVCREFVEVKIALLARRPAAQMLREIAHESRAVAIRGDSGQGRLMCCWIGAFDITYRG
jgi:hypothetical protein